MSCLVKWRCPTPTVKNGWETTCGYVLTEFAVFGSVRLRKQCKHCKAWHEATFSSVEALLPPNQEETRRLTSLA